MSPSRPVVSHDRRHPDITRGAADLLNRLVSRARARGIAAPGGLATGKTPGQPGNPPTQTPEANGEAANARTDFGAFLGAVGVDPSGAPLVMDAYARLMAIIWPHCYALRWHVSHVAPQGLGKSTLGRLFALWCLGRDPSTRVVVVSGEATVAENSVTLCREIIIGNQFRRIFPEVRTDNERSQYADRRGSTLRGWRQDQFFLVTEGQSPDPAMAAVAIRGLAENRRVDLLLADDVMTQVIAESAERREAHCKTMREKWLNGRLKLGGVCFAIQNCWHEADLAHQWLRDDRIASVWVGVREDCGSLYVRITHAPPSLLALLRERAQDLGLVETTALPLPGQSGGGDWDYCAEMALPQGKPGYSRAELETFARNDPHSFAKSCRLIALTDRDRMVPSWSQRQIAAPTVAKLLNVGETDTGLPILERGANGTLARWSVVAGVDLSAKGRNGTGFWILGKSPEGIIYPLYHARGEWTIEQLVDALDFAITTLGFPVSEIVVENNAVQSQIVEIIRVLAKKRNLDWWGIVRGFATGANKMDPAVGLPGIDVLFSNGAARWVSDEAKRPTPSGAAWQLFEGEMVSCPRLIKRGTTPDGIMMFWFALHRLREMAAPGTSSPPATARAQTFGGSGRMRGIF